MNLITFDEIFKKIHIQMGSSPSESYKLHSRWQTEIDLNWSKVESFEGLELSISAIKASSLSTLQYRGKNVVLYLAKVRTYEPKFHISECKKILEMKEKGKYDRYTVTTNPSDYFSIVIQGEQQKCKLKVCRLCLDALNYKGYRDVSWDQKNNILENFKLKDFLTEYKQAEEKNLVNISQPDTLDKIIEIIRKAGKNIEEQSQTFIKHNENELRNVLLTYLNLPYLSVPMSATGETFRRNGKTDILIRLEDENKIVGECKIWRGQETTIIKGLKQLSGYLTWRDTALFIVFNTEYSIVNTVKNMHKSLEDHDCIDKLTFSKHNSGEWKCIFNTDKGGLDLYIFMFDIRP